MQNTEIERAMPAQKESRPYPASMERAAGPQTLPPAIVPEQFADIAALCPIGAFDSGLGGLSIIEELRRTLPHEDIIYYADNGNCPYGGRPYEWLRARVVYITQFLIEQGAKAIVVACNTASAAGLEHLRAIYSVPIVGLVPAVKPAVAATRTGTVGVLATPATMKGQLLADVIERFAEPAGVEVVTVAPEGLVEAVERGDLATPQTREVVERALEPMLSRGVDAIVLGCTHYPFLTPIIEEIAGPGVQVIDSSGGVSRQTAHVLEARHLLRREPHKGRLTVYTSGDLAVVAPLVRMLAGEDVPVLTESSAPRAEDSLMALPPLSQS